MRPPDSIPAAGASDSRYASLCRTTLLGAAFTLGFTAAYAAFGAEPALTGPATPWATLASEAATSDSAKPKLDFSTDSAARKSYSIPAAEIVGFEALLNLANRGDPSGDFKSNLSTIRRN